MRHSPTSDMMASARGRSSDRVFGVDRSGSALEPENPQSLNLYAYVLDNPLRYTDPDGLSPQDSTTVAIGTSFHSTWREIDDPSAPHFRLFGGANGQLGPQADYDSVVDKSLLYQFQGSVSMTVEATFVTDDKGNVTATITTEPTKPDPCRVRGCIGRS